MITGLHGDVQRFFCDAVTAHQGGSGDASSADHTVVRFLHKIIKMRAEDIAQ